jgi:putative transposase
MCQLAGVSRAGCYRRWQQREPRRAETMLRHRLHELALANRHYGHRRLGALLRREGWVVNHKRVLRLTREDNLLCLRRRRFVPATTDSRHRWRVYPNLARQLRTTATDQLWVADITCLRLEEGFASLAVLLDATLALTALHMALAHRAVVPGALVHHSDRGVQYACSDYVGLLESRGIIASMSRIACPYDNAMAESFMKTLKQEEVDGQAYRNLAHAKSCLGEFIETTYNRQRLHSALAYAAPQEFEDEQANR